MNNVLLVPFTSSLVIDYIEYWRRLVKESFGKAGVDIDVKVWPEVLTPPIKCYDWMRRQYYAPCLLELLYNEYSFLGEGYKIVGLGYLDGYDQGLNFVFGEADPYRGVAIVFTKRLNPVFYGEDIDWNKYFWRVVKEIVHELGHLYGLKHCITPRCVMNFSNSVYEVDLKDRFFCDKCSKLLKNMLDI